MALRIEDIGLQFPQATTINKSIGLQRHLPHLYQLYPLQSILVMLGVALPLST